MNPLLKIQILLGSLLFLVFTLTAIAMWWGKHIMRLIDGLRRDIDGKRYIRPAAAVSEEVIVEETRPEAAPSSKGPGIVVSQTTNAGTPAWKFLVVVVAGLVALGLLAFILSFFTNGKETVEEKAKDHAGFGFSHAALNCRSDCTPQPGFDGVTNPAPKNEDGYIVIKGARCVGNDNRCGASCFPRCENLADVPPNPNCWCDNERLKAD